MMNKHLMSVVMAAIMVGAGWPVTADPPDPQVGEGARFINHGVAVDVGTSFGSAVFETNENRVLLMHLHSYATQGFGLSLLAIDLDTGESRQFEYEGPNCNSGGPFKSLRASNQKWYTLFGGYFYEFDPAVMEFTHVQDTHPLRTENDSGRRSVAMGVWEDDEGIIWMTCFPYAELISYHPDRGDLFHHGILNEESWRQYTNRGLAMDREGWIYAVIGNVLAQVVGYDTRTGEVRSFLGQEERQPGIGQVYSGKDGRVYAISPGWGWHVLEGGEATPVAKPPVGDVMMHFDRRSESSDRLPVMGMKDGSQVSHMDVANRHLIITEADSGKRRLDFDYQSNGALIFTLVNTPTNGIYGSVRRPNRVFRFDVNNEMTQHAEIPRGGFNAVAIQGETFFGGMYTSGPGLASFDFGKPVNPGSEPESNPRYFLPRAYPDINRPHAVLAHPDGRHVIMGGTPGYGLTGGGLMIYDTGSGRGRVLKHTRILEHHSTCALVALSNGNLVGGTTVAPGTGGVVLAKEAQLYLFDWGTREVVWHEAILPGRQAIRDLMPGLDGLVFGIADDATFFVFDPEQRKLIHKESLAPYGRPAGAQDMRMMTLGPDGMLYLLFRHAIVALDTSTFEHRKLARSPEPIYAGVVIRDGRLYFGSGSEIWSFSLAEEWGETLVSDQNKKIGW